MALAQNFAELSPTAVQTTKEAVLTLQDETWETAFAREAALGQPRVEAAFGKA